MDALSTKVGKLTEDKETLLEAVDILEESKDLPFKSSEQAVIISEDVDKKSETIGLDPQSVNSLLSPEVMKFMPQSDLN